MQLAALLAPVDRIAPGQRSPLFARTEAASTIAEVQSTSPRAPSSSRTARCNRLQSPASVQAENRRCAVAGDTSNVSGRCRHAHPLVSTYTTAVNTARSSHGAVPPPCGRDAKGGSNGATSAQSSSGTNRCDRPTPMARHHAASNSRHVRQALSRLRKGTLARRWYGRAVHHARYGHRVRRFPKTSNDSALWSPHAEGDTVQARGRSARAAGTVPPEGTGRQGVAAVRGLRCPPAPGGRRGGWAGSTGEPAGRSVGPIRR